MMVETRAGKTVTTIVPVPANKENVASNSSPSEVVLSRRATGIQSPSYSLEFGDLTIAEETVENGPILHDSSETTSLPEASTSTVTLNSMETSAPIDADSNILSNADENNGMESAAEGEAMENLGEKPEAPPAENTVTICTGELKAFFPAKIDHFANVDNYLMAHVSYEKYYETTEHLELHNRYHFKLRNSKIEDGRKLKTKNVTKRGSLVYACPYCHQVAPAGDRQTIIRHMNKRTAKGGKITVPACTQRREKEPRDENGTWPMATLAPVLIKN